jgi:hypothetical protein
VVELNVFGSLAFAKKVAMGLIKTELSLCKSIEVLIDPFSPFICSVEPEQQFPNF